MKNAPPSSAWRTREPPPHDRSNAPRSSGWPPQGRTVPAIAAHLRLHAQTARDWLKRFNAERAGRAGRPAPPRQAADLYARADAARSIAAALTDPQDAGPALRLLDAGSAGGVSERGEEHCRSSAAASANSWSPKACAGGSRRPGSASGLIPTSPKKGAHRKPLHRAARRQRRDLPGRDGAAERQELSRAAAGARRPPTPEHARRAGHSRRSTTDGAAGAMSSARSARPPATRSPRPMAGARLPTGSTFWSRSRPGCPPRPSGSMRFWTTSAPTGRPMCCCFVWRIRAGSSCSSPCMRRI